MEDLKLILNIEGFWREKNKNFIPAISGIFFVYENKHNQSGDLIQLKRLLYVGEAENIRDRIQNHENYKLWKSEFSDKSDLVFSIAPVSSKFRLRVKSTFVNFHKPKYNHFSDFIFNYEKTILISLGKTNFIEALVKIEKDENCFANDLLIG